MTVQITLDSVVRAATEIPGTRWGYESFKVRTTEAQGMRSVYSANSGSFKIRVEQADITYEPRDEMGHPGAERRVSYKLRLLWDGKVRRVFDGIDDQRIPELFQKMVFLYAAAHHVPRRGNVKIYIPTVTPKFVPEAKK